MILKRGNCDSIEELVCQNTSMDPEKLLKDQENYQINGLEEFGNIMRSRISQKKTIYVFGDYDVDGVCASAIIQIGMNSIGYGNKTIVRLPRRFTEGYGVSEKAICEFEDNQVLITVDNGISAIDAIKKAKEKGMTVIIIDHHLPQKDKQGNAVLPDADLIIDPKAIPGSSDFDGYCGAGLAYKAMRKLVTNSQAIWKMYCISALATVADVVPLAGENRRTVKAGLENITNMKYATSGLYALLLACECNEYVNEEIVAFKLAPCLNAPGRLMDYGSYESFKLLSFEGSLKEAKVMAEKQIEYNETRKQLSDEWTAKAKEAVTSKMLLKEKPIIMQLDGIPEGIVGIVAGKISEYTKTPCIILAQAEGTTGLLKGSARTYGDVHLFNLINEGAQYLTRFGGHKEAAGLSIHQDNLSAFKECLNRAYERDYPEVEEDTNIYYDLLLDGGDRMSLASTLDDIRKYGPYGQGNPSPVLYIKNLLLTPVGSAHFKYMGDHSAVKLMSTDLDCVSFDDVDRFERMGAPTLINVVGTVTLNYYMGKYKYQLEFIEIEECERYRKKPSALASLLAKKAAERRGNEGT